MEPKDQTTISSQSQNDTSTTPSSIAAETFDTTNSHILRESLKHIDHVPASRILTEGLETHAINQYTGNALLEGTTEASNPLAIEINDGLEATTNYPYIEDFENNQRVNFTAGPSTEYPSFGTTVSPSLLSFDLLPPSDVNKGIDEGVPVPIDENDLQRAQSQSMFGNGRNKLERTGKEFGEKTQPKSLKTENGHYITEFPPTVTPSPDLSKTTNGDNGKVNPNTWSTLSYSVFLDPLTINDGLMSGNDQSTTAPSQHTFNPYSTPTYNGITEPTVPQDTGNDITRQGKAQPFPETASPTHDDYMQVMQRKANEMFGNLNDTQADHLMNVMKKADKNKNVRRLILLLIQTCDDDYNTTVEQSREALLNALIRMDSKLEDENELQIIKTYRSEKALNLNRQQLNAASTTTQLPITTYHRPLNVHFDQSTHIPQTSYYTETTTSNYPSYQTSDYYTDSTIAPNFEYSTIPTTFSTESVDTTTTTYYQSPTTTYEPIQTSIVTTTQSPPPPITTTGRPSVRRKPVTTTAPSGSRNSKRLAKDLDQYLANQGDTNYNVNQAHRNSDARALELLRSLYSLAGRFGK